MKIFLFFCMHKNLKLYSRVKRCITSNMLYNCGKSSCLTCFEDNASSEAWPKIEGLRLAIVGNVSLFVYVFDQRPRTHF